MLKAPQLARGASHALRGDRRRRWPSSTETRDEFRGLLRKLLREASYLPDTTARSYFHSHIISRFRAYQPPQGSSRPNERPVKRNWNATNLLVRRDKIERLRIQAHRTLSLLAQANAGRFRDVDQVLNLAYGRAGPLREQLLQPYLLLNEPKDDAALRSSIAEHRSPKPDGKNAKPVKPQNDPNLPPALVALAKSQIAHRGQLHGPDQIRTLHRTIPTKNMWGRPMPLCRVRNLKRKIYVNLMHKVLPPLPKAQWEQLRRLAMGEEQWEGRTRPIPTTRTSEAYRLGNRLSRTTPRPVKSRKIDQRFMQHRYRTLFGQTPCITWRPDTQKWKVEYGTPAPPRILTTTSSTLQQFGIDIDKNSRNAGVTETNASSTYVELG